MTKKEIQEVVEAATQDFNTGILPKEEYHKILVATSYDYLSAFGDLDSALEALCKVPEDYFQAEAIDSALDDPEFKGLLTELAELFERYGAFGDGLELLAPEAQA